MSVYFSCSLQVYGDGGTHSEEKLSIPNHVSQFNLRFHL